MKISKTMKINKITKKNKKSQKSCLFYLNERGTSKDE